MNFKSIWLSLAIMLVALAGPSRDAIADEAKSPNTGPQPSSVPGGILFPHTILDRALSIAVDDHGMVDYLKLRGDANLNRYLAEVARADLSKFPTYEIKPDPKVPNSKATTDHSAEMVLWINAYNGYVLKTLADAYPVDSPDDIKDFDTAPHMVGGKNYSLHGMRDVIVKFDARAIFALTDGTKGGPLLSKSAYRFSNINARLDNAVEEFVNDPNNVDVLRIAGKVTVSNFLEPLNELFITTSTRRKQAGIRNLLAAYSSKKGNRGYFESTEYEVEFKDRSRALNIKAHD